MPTENQSNTALAPRPCREFRDKLNALPRYMFLLKPSDVGIQKLEDSTGNWIDVHEAQQVVDQAQEEINQLRAERDALLLRLNAADQRIDELTAQNQGEPVAYLYTCTFDEYQEPEVRRAKLRVNVVTKGWIEEPLYTAPVAADIAHDRAYRNGLMAGFQFGIGGNEKGYAESLERYGIEIHEAKAKQCITASVLLPDRKPPYATAPDNDMRVRLECKNKGYNKALDDVLLQGAMALRVHPASHLRGESVYTTGEMNQ